MSHRGILPAASAVVSALALAVLLTGCSEGQAPAASSSPTAATTAATSTATPPPTPVVESSPTARPLDALSAWNACAEIAKEKYVAEYPGSSIRPFDPASARLITLDDGSVQMYVGVKPSPPPAPEDGWASIVVICTMSGTADAPVVEKWTMKDV